METLSQTGRANPPGGSRGLPRGEVQRDLDWRTGEGAGNGEQQGAPRLRAQGCSVGVSWKDTRVPENVLWHLGGSVPRREGLATWCMGTEQRTGQGRGSSVGTHSGSRVEPEVGDRRGEERFEQVAAFELHPKRQIFY